jgi:hypothetical protein
MTLRIEEASIAGVYTTFIQGGHEAQSLRMEICMMRIQEKGKILNL